MIPLEEAEKIEGFPVRSTLRRWCVAGDVRGEQVRKGSRLTWLVDPNSVRAFIQKNSGGSIADLIEQWKRELSTGYHTGKANGQETVYLYDYGLTKFWEYLNYIPVEDRSKDYKPKAGALTDITADKLRKALAAVPVDYQKRTCHFSQREHMYKSVCSFMQFLIRNRFIATVELEQARKLKPKRVFPPRKTVVKEDQLQKLLITNDSYKDGRTDFDVSLTRTIIMLAVMTGMRRQEIIDLEVGHIDFKNQEIFIYDGKGHKNGRVGIVPKLLAQLEEWLEIRPKSTHRNLLLTKRGTPLDEGGIHRRLSRITAEAKVDVTLHGLRRSFATINTEKGMPIPIAQQLLRHSNIKTTMEYILIDEQTAVDYLKVKPQGV